MVRPIPQNNAALISPPVTRALLGSAVVLGGVALFGASVFATLAAANLTGRLSTFNFVASMGRHTGLTLGLSIPGMVAGFSAAAAGVILIVTRNEKKLRQDEDEAARYPQPVVHIQPVPQPQHIKTLSEKVVGLSAMAADEIPDSLYKELRDDIVNCINNNQLEILSRTMNELKNNERQLSLIIAIIYNNAQKRLEDLQNFIHSLGQFTPEQLAFINECISREIATDKSILHWEVGTVNEGSIGAIHSRIEGNQFIWGSDVGITRKTFRILFDLRQVLGRGDFTQHSPYYQIKPEVVNLIGRAMVLLGNVEKDEIRRNLDRPLEHIGVELCIEQFDELRFPASVITPFLPHIAEIPGVVKLELKDIGIPRENEPHVTAGFGDEDAQLLLNIFKKQPFLKHAVLNIDRMTQKDKFKLDWDAIKASHTLHGSYVDFLRTEAT